MIAHIWTDGSANNHTHDNGGYGIFIEYRVNNQVVETVQITGGRFSNTTSARMEIKAILEALASIKPGCQKVFINTDNEYCANTINLGWLIKWKNENWVDRKNSDLWKQIDDILGLQLFELHIKWIKGHNGTTQNELADRLASEGAHRKSNTVDQIQQ